MSPRHTGDIVDCLIEQKPNGCVSFSASCARLLRGKLRTFVGGSQWCGKLGCRSRERGRLAARRIEAALDGDGSVGRAEFLAELDLADLNSVRAFVLAYRDRFRTLDVLGKKSGLAPKCVSTSVSTANI